MQRIPARISLNAPAPPSSPSLLLLVATAGWPSLPIVQRLSEEKRTPLTSAPRGDRDEAFGGSARIRAAAGNARENFIATIIVRRLSDDTILYCVKALCIRFPFFFFSSRGERESARKPEDIPDIPKDSARRNSNECSELSGENNKKKCGGIGRKGYLRVPRIVYFLPWCGGKSGGERGRNGGGARISCAANVKSKFAEGEERKKEGKGRARERERIRRFASVKREERERGRGEEERIYSDGSDDT